MKSKKILNLSLLLLFFIGGFVFLLNSCNKREEIKTDDVNTLKSKYVKVNKIKSKEFDGTVNRLMKKYPLEINIDNKMSSYQTLCGPDEDDQIECSDEVVTLPLPIAGTQVVYHPSLPPMDCGLIVQMDARFCKNKEIDNSVVTFTNFTFVSFINPVSDLCIDWLIAYNQLPYLERAIVYSKLVADYEAAYELLWMQNWSSDPNNDFDPCPDDGSVCSLENTAVQAKYYKAACNKVCLVYDKNCDKDDIILGFLCQKEIPCYADGCCKRETGYCYNEETGEVEVCHEAYYIVGECTIPIPDDPCFIEMKACSTTPDCIQ